MDNNAEKTVEIFKALSCKSRLDIVLGLIKNNKCSVCRIAEELNIPQPNISQHLTILKSAGIIEGYRNGVKICYKVVDEKTKKIIKALDLLN